MSEVSKLVIIWILFFGIACKEHVPPVPTSPIEKLEPIEIKVKEFQAPDYNVFDWSEIKDNKYFKLDIRYATEHNFSARRAGNTI